MTVDKYYKQLDKVDYWIANADTKASFVLAFSGVLSGFLFSDETIEQQNVDNHTDSFINLPNTLLTLTIISLIITITFSLLVLSARTKGVKHTLFFWGDISKYTHWSYYLRAKLRETDDALEKDLIYQIYINSKICNKKFKRYRLTLRFLIISLVLFAVHKIITILL
ncbi:Pycsar system effector family protein [Oceanobacillus timonensis]|uniref:Pycsar system effector family protein n=1 Tax=Oceanobacillus timonensis TaxID=1926285 RepID=UPI0009BA1995|nr:Pycsar system effector family protein [Oceanobacillus timonensis]